MRRKLELLAELEDLDLSDVVRRGLRSYVAEKMDDAGGGGAR